MGDRESYEADQEFRPARTADRYKTFGIESRSAWEHGRPVGTPVAAKTGKNSAARRPGYRHKQLSPYPFQRAGEKKSSRFTKLLALATWFRSDGTLILAAKRAGLGRFRRPAIEARARELGAWLLPTHEIWQHAAALGA